MSFEIRGTNGHPKSGIYESLYDLRWITVKFPLLPTAPVGYQRQGKAASIHNATYMPARGLKETRAMYRCRSFQALLQECHDGKEGNKLSGTTKQVLLDYISSPR